MLALLSQSRLSEFHTELEAIGAVNIKNIYINHPVAIEQSLMEGSYNKVWRARANVPAKEYSYFMDILTGTIRFISFNDQERDWKVQRESLPFVTNSRCYDSFVLQVPRRDQGIL